MRGGSRAPAATACSPPSPRSTTHYGIGSAPPFFGAGYVDLPTWWKIGFAMSVLYITVFLGIGPIWWKAIGLM